MSQYSCLIPCYCNKPDREKLFVSRNVQIQSSRKTHEMSAGKGKATITLRKNGNFSNSVTNARIS